MILDLAKLTAIEGKTEKQNLSYEHDEFVLGDNKYSIVSKEDINLTLTNVEKGKISISGDFSMEVEIPCDRCLVPVTNRVEAKFDELVDTITDGDEYDLDELLHKELVMDWPMKVLCTDDCKGICPSCGCNLNESSCECDNEVLDPRMAAFLDVFNSSKI